MLDAFWWLLTVEAIGLAAFPLAYLLLPSVRDRGYSVSKPLGILFIGYASWILSVLHIVPSVRLSIVALLLVMGGLSAWYVWRHRQEFKEFVVRERGAIIAGEVIFLAFFVGWTIYRAYDPAIDHTEQPMDFAFLNASIASTVGAPEDLWFRGEAVSYYYFGYWMMGVISQLAGIASNISYNLSMALIPAMAAVGIFGLVYNMVRAEALRWRYALIAGIAAVVIMGVISNLTGVLEFMRANAMGSQAFWAWVRIDGLAGPNLNPTTSWMPQEFGWWFHSTRVINTFVGDIGTDFTIQEFPFFSFMLGDLHPHVMSIPFAFLFLAFAWNFFRSPVLVWGQLGKKGYLSILVMGLALGGLAFTNMWDLPTFAALFLAMAALKTYSAHGGGAWMLIRGTIPIGVAVIGLAAVLFLPYLISFKAGVSGIGTVTTTTARPIHLLIVWALFLVAVTPFIVGSFWQTVVRSDWRRLTTYGLLVGLVPYLVWVFLHAGASGDLVGRFFHVLPFIILIGLAVYSALWLAKWRGASGQAFGLALAALGLLLIMGPELLFVDDIFVTPNERMNTVFKLYYQAWILLAVASGFAIYYWGSLRETLSGWTRALTTLWAGVFIVLLAGSLYYPPAAAAGKGDLFEGDPTLDGLAFVAQSRRAEYEAIKFVKSNAGQDSAILEAVGEWFDAGLISRSTGVPTVFNWPGHQIQWRGTTEKFDGRSEDVARIYQTSSFQEAKSLLSSYDVEFVYVGPRERQKYGTDGLAKFSLFMETVFSQDDVVIYRIKP